VVIYTKLIVVKGGDSWGISVTGETPQVAIATEEAHRTPPGKHPPFTEINESILPSHPHRNVSSIYVRKFIQHKTIRRKSETN
jgi:hypothetical protein